MGTNLELEQEDRLSQQALTAQVRATISDRDTKVSVLSVFALVGSSNWLKILDPVSPGLECSPRNDIGAVSNSRSRISLKEC
jgi:hypothetical protein